MAVAQDDPERVVLVAETTATGDDRAALVARIRAAVAARADLPGVTVHLVSPRTIPRTSSGKLRRLDMAGRIRDNDRVNR